jgi:hypothetical protein
MWGDNLGGQLAQTNLAVITAPTIVLKKDGKPIHAKKVDATQYSTYCITTEGTSIKDALSCFMISPNYNGNFNRNLSELTKHERASLRKLLKKD